MPDIDSDPELARLTNDQSHTLQQVRDALPGIVHTVTVLREALERAWDGKPNRFSLAAEVYARLDSIRAATTEVEQLVAPYADQSPLEDLGISIRAVTALRNWEGVRTIAQLGELTERDLADVPGIGDVLRREIKAQLRKRGITLSSPR